MAIKKKFVYSLTLALAPIVFRLLTTLLFATCRVRVKGRQHREYVENHEKSFIAAFWHYAIIYVTFVSRGLSWVCMVSASKDGEYIARILEGMGYRTVRGSKGKGGAGALKGMVGAMKEGLNAAIVADGSQGPARVVQSGVILLASKTGAPILPVTWAADRYFAVRSWDRTALPKPFSKIELVYGPPLEVPGKISSEELESFRLQLEERLNLIYEQAWGAFNQKSH